jgi:hypothetical protein
MGNNHIRNSITKGQPPISGEFFKDLFSGNPYRVFVSNNKKAGFDRLKESNCDTVIYPVSKECNSFTYNIPGSIKQNIIIFAIFKKFTSFFKINIIRIERGKKE